MRLVWILSLLSLLSLPVAAQSAFWQDNATPKVPTVAAVPTVPQISTPLPSPKPAALPVIADSVILNLSTSTISGCQYSGKLCVFNLPVTVSGKIATGQLGALRFQFNLP